MSQSFPQPQEAKKVGGATCHLYEWAALTLINNKQIVGVMAKMEGSSARTTKINGFITLYRPHFISIPPKIPGSKNAESDQTLMIMMEELAEIACINEKSVILMVPLPETHPLVVQIKARIRQQEEDAAKQAAKNMETAETLNGKAGEPEKEPAVVQ